MSRGFRIPRRVLRQAMAVLMLVCVPAAQAAAADKCMTRTEYGADRVRSLQSALMVAALKCVHRPELGLREHYNEFVRRFGDELIVHSDVLQEYFRRAYGAGHRHEINEYVTGLANAYSIRTFEYPNFCEEMAALGKSILDQGAGTILNLAFDTRRLAPSATARCDVTENKDFVFLQDGKPDLVAVHMPDIDMKLRREAHQATDAAMRAIGE